MKRNYSLSKQAVACPPQLAACVATPHTLPVNYAELQNQRVASRSLHLHRPRAWLRHTPYCELHEISKTTCRVCAVRTHAVG